MIPFHVSKGAVTLAFFSRFEDYEFSLIGNSNFLLLSVNNFSNLVGLCSVCIEQWLPAK